MLTRLTLGLINLFLWLTEIFLGLRFLLRFFAANPGNGFVNWIYNSSNVLLQPFRGIFPTTVIGNNHIVDFSTLFAMAIYAVFGLAVMAFVGIVGGSIRNSMRATTEDTDRVVKKSARRF